MLGHAYALVELEVSRYLLSTVRMTEESAALSISDKIIELIHTSLDQHLDHFIFAT